MNSVKEASVDDTEIPRIMEIESANKDDFISKIEDVLEFLNTSTKISLLYANDFIQKYVREEIMSDESDLFRSNLLLRGQSKVLKETLLLFWEVMLQPLPIQTPDC